jgi:hypothetical protein
VAVLGLVRDAEEGGLRGLLDVLGARHVAAPVDGHNPPLGLEELRGLADDAAGDDAFDGLPSLLHQSKQNFI